MGIKFLQNIDAERNKFEEAGFEVVTSLPTTNLFVGRQVMYNGQLYVYNGSQWVNVNAPYEANLCWGGRNISDSFSPIDAGMMSELSANVMAFPNPTGISVEYSRDGGVTWLDYGATDEQKVKLFTTGQSFSCGRGGTADLPLQLRITITPLECGLYASLNKIIMKINSQGIPNCRCTFKALTGSNVDAGNEDDSYYRTIIDKAYILGTTGYNVLNFNTIYTRPSGGSYPNFFHRLRLIFEYEVIEGATRNALSVAVLRFFGIHKFVLPSNLANSNHLYTYDWKQNALFPGRVESKEIINFDITNIEPTQTGRVTKTSTWMWQYLVQGVNWLKANKVALSVYNAKVAELVQADSANNAYIQNVKEAITALIDEVSGGLANLAAVARSGSYNDLTDTPTLAPVATSGDYNDLSNKPAFSGSYNDLTDKPTIPSTFEDLGGNLAAAQISEGSIANSKLVNSSMLLNGTTVNLGDSAILPWYVSYNGVDYPARFQDNWLQIYRNEEWANLLYLAGQEPALPTEVVQITSFANLSWYDERVSEYEIDSNTTFELLDGKFLIASQLLQCPANQLTLNLYPIPSGRYNKGALDAVIADLQKNNFAVFAENDLDAILASGSDFCVRIKISKVPTYKAIIECYVAR